MARKPIDYRSISLAVVVRVGCRALSNSFFLKRRWRPSLKEGRRPCWTYRWRDRRGIPRNKAASVVHINPESFDWCEEFCIDRLLCAIAPMVRHCKLETGGIGSQSSTTCDNKHCRMPTCCLAGGVDERLAWMGRGSR